MRKKGGLTYLTVAYCVYYGILLILVQMSSLVITVNQLTRAFFLSAFFTLFHALSLFSIFVNKVPMI